MALLHRAVGSREVPNYARLFLVKVCLTPIPKTLKVLSPSRSQPITQIPAAHVKPLLSRCHFCSLCKRNLLRLVTGGSPRGSPSSGP